MEVDKFKFKYCQIDKYIGRSKFTDNPLTRGYAVAKNVLKKG